MHDTEAAIAWRLFSYNWVVLGLIALALALTMALTGFSIDPLNALLPLGIPAVYTAAAYYKAHKRDPKVIFILGSTGQLLLVPVIMTPMTYIAASAGLPLQDAHLAALDRALGFNWSAYYDLISAHPTWVAVAMLAYTMIGWPLFGVPIALGLTRRYRRLQEFTLAFALALIVTTAITALVPAVGIYDAHSFTRSDAAFASESYLQHLHDFPLLRDGGLRHLELTKLTGIVTFPSFHAAAAAVYLWALWSVWWMRPIALLANGGMLLATPFIGGHYFIDVFAGIAVAVAAIAAAQAIMNYLARPVAQRLAPAPAASDAMPAEPSRG
jgi:membrane-associated phospholipid phosphatase